MSQKSPALFAIVAIYVLLGILYARFTPPWQAPDEPAHYNYVRYVAQNLALPELASGCYNQAYLSQLTAQKFPPHLPVDSICYEHYQPPLYYLLAAPVYAATGGSLFALRLLSVGLGGLALLMVFKTVRLFLPRTIFPAATTAFVAFVPMHLTMLAAVNNDSLAELLFISLTYLLLGWLLARAQTGAPPPFIAGAALGLILLTKVTVYTALPLAAVTLFLADRRPRPLLKNALRVYLPALAMALPLYLRNALVYGGLDILGLRRHDAVVVGQLRTAQKLAEQGWPGYLSDMFRTTFHSFWGQFGWMAVPMDGWVYLALNVAQWLAAAGLALWLWRNPPRSTALRQALAVMAAALALAGSVFVGLNLSFVQFQGRYFFTALMPLGLFFSLGLFEAARRENAVAATGVPALRLGWTVVASAGGGGPGKWGLLITGGALAALLVRRRLPDAASGWYLGGTLALLAALSGAGLWWFIIPNL
ncbi:MAG: ArnT family glycosyltransferase [Anaerolineae bacterium]